MKYVTIELNDDVFWTYNDLRIFYRIVNECLLASVNEEASALDDLTASLKDNKPVKVYEFKVYDAGFIDYARIMIDILLPGPVFFKVRRRPRGSFAKWLDKTRGKNTLLNEERSDLNGKTEDRQQ